MIKNLRWYIVGLLTLVTVINYLDRNALSVAQVRLQEELDITKPDYGRIVSAFLIAYGLFHPLAGRIVDGLGSRLGLSLAFIWWSLASIGHAFAGGVRSFAAFRFLLGIGESGNFPAAIKTVGEWFPAKERALATGILNVGTGVGAMVAPPLVGVIMYYLGWRAAFILTGSIGVVWLIPWLILGRQPERHPMIAPEELAYIRAGQTQESLEGAAPPPRGLWREAVVFAGGLMLGIGIIVYGGEFYGRLVALLQLQIRLPVLGVTRLWVLLLCGLAVFAIAVLSRMPRQLWALMLARMLSDPVWLFFSFWIPLYFKEARGFDLKSIAMFAWLPFLAADVGSIAGGWLSSFFIGRGLSTITARKIALCCSASLMPVTILAVHVQSWQAAVLCVSIAAFAHQSWSASTLTLPADVFPKRMVASCYGLTAMMGVLGGAVTQWYVGTVIQSVGYTPVFTVAGCLHPIGALAVVLFVKSAWSAGPAKAKASVTASAAK